MLPEVIKNEFMGWKRWEIIWLVLTSILITAVAIFIGDKPLGVITALLGILCVICTGKGKLSAYVFGLLHAIAYSIIAYHSKYYGEVMLNLIYYAPMQFYGFYIWTKNMNPDTNEVYKKSLNLKYTIIMLITVAVLTLVYGMILNLLRGNLPFVDALSTVVGVVALYISVKMYAEQWILWIIVNFATVIMWAHAFIYGHGSVAVLLMWSIYLINSFIMYFKWKNETNKNNDAINV